ncbi:hypothetical protein C4559_03310 [Candidatus Microgenomates bacterium]|nr:MAG: hypothetical protein C4559_03310 [Candidatus Microgenomates bacterium]
MKKFILLFLIIIIALIFRFWNLSENPPSLSHDEVAIGYNAWSILQTGKDEYGQTFPLFFRSFDDYKLPGYIYLTVLSEKIFGLNEFAVRFPSAFLGVLTVIVFYFLIKELSYKLTNFQISLPLIKEKKILFSIPEIAAFMLAISPWHTNFSRAAFESNGSLFFILLGMYSLFKALRKPKYSILAALSFVISIYFYYTIRVFVPLILLVFLFVYRKKIFEYKKYFLSSLILGLIFLLPILPGMLTTGMSRINQVSIFEDKTLTNPYSEAIVRNNNSMLAKIIYNRRMAYFQEFSDNYLKNFAPDFYFVNGTGSFGLLYIWEIPFFIFGFYSLLKVKEKWKWIFITWFLSVPLAGGLTTGQPNALRTLANVPMLTFFSSFGIYNLILILKNNRFLKLFYLCLITVILFFIFRFFVIYFDYIPFFTALHWGDGHKKMAGFVKDNINNYDDIYVTGDYWRPYTYFLFYSKYSPSEYQKKGSRSKIENITFGQAGWDSGEGLNLAKDDLSKLVKRRTLFILSSSDFQIQKNLIESEKRPYQIKMLKEIDGSVAKNAFYAVKLR